MSISLSRELRPQLAAVLLGVVAAALPCAAFAQDDGLAALRQPGTHLLMRHATAPGTGDPDNFKLVDCTTQRNLDGKGRAEARALGDRLRANGIKIDGVLSSQWCRARETAELLGFGAVTPEPALNSFFEDRSTGSTQTEALKAKLSNFGKDRKMALVTHQVNITALTGVVPTSGEMVIVSLGEGGAVEVRGRIRPD